jgi:ATP-binding cassette, subfamily B, bacterial
VVAAPQFHENHVLMASLCFNLLMGRGWPPRPDDLHEAEAVCRALDLGPLLDAMPGGLHQLVGETGWQLSHGERSRIYLARALLQGASVVILDESFAALDPSSLEHCVRCALDRAPSLLVIAHP